jgi:DNA-binding NarL/FixJ family response regulator
VEKHIEKVASNQKEDMGVPHAWPGIMLLTASMKLLYKDQRAWELCQEIIRCQDGRAANGVLPLAVVSLVAQIQKMLEVRPYPMDWEQSEIRQVVNTLHSSVLLCGTPFIDPTHTEKRILIVMNEVGIGAWMNTAIVQTKERFRLTARETTVVQHLLQGWTNKEIANEMQITEHTIKEHFKHISHKMATSTRIGIVMKIIHAGLHHAPTSRLLHVRVPTMRSGPTKLVGAA